MIGVIKEQENCLTNSFTVIKKTGYPRIVIHELGKNFDIQEGNVVIK